MGNFFGPFSHAETCKIDLLSIFDGAAGTATFSGNTEITRYLEIYHRNSPM